MLTEFYAKHDPSKTAAQIQKLAAKYEGPSFEKLCGKLEEKYGASPRKVWEAQGSPKVRYRYSIARERAMHLFPLFLRTYPRPMGIFPSAALDSLQSPPFSAL